MIRKHNVNEINLEITNVDFWSENRMNKGGMRIFWNSDVGFGNLDIYKTEGNNGHDFESPRETMILNADTENMDIQNDKAFTRKLLSLMADYLKIDD